MTHVLSRIACAATAMLSVGGWHASASAQSTDPFLGQIMCGAFNFPPRGWARLDGQLLQITTNIPLFSMLGTMYGGDGINTFRLPDLRGRVMLHDGQGPELTVRRTGDKGGSETVTMNNAQLPAHTHTVTPQGSPGDATLVSPANGVPATKARTTLYAPGPGTVPMSPVLSSAAGSNAPVPLMQPFLVMNCFIAVQGVFPPRD